MSVSAHEIYYANRATLNINITNPGNITIALTDLENFEELINVFIYDSPELHFGAVEIREKCFRKVYRLGTENHFRCEAFFFKRNELILSVK